jgi:hypothetical protein
MTEQANMPRALRLTSRFFAYDPDRGQYVSKSWAEGAIVTDPDEIALLEARGAPFERIETSEAGESNERTRIFTDRW